jgi:enediyne biosynthesis protein E4
MMKCGTKQRIAIVASIAAVFCFALDQPVFQDVSATAGIRFIHKNSPTTNKYLPETMGGGVALFDYDNDGDLDIFFTNGARIDDPMPPGKLPEKRDSSQWNRLYSNDGSCKYTDVTERSGLAGASTGYGMGVAVGDYDNDGFSDLYLTSFNRNFLYRNRGDGTFEDVTAKAGVGASGWSTSAGFFDFNNDGHLDLFVTRYLDWRFETNIHCGEREPGARAYCHPDNFKGITNLLFRSNGNGTFTDVSETSGVAKHMGKGLGVAFADYDDDGWTDIYVANDSVMCFLFRNKGNGTFEETALAAGAGYNEDGRPYAGMGVDMADFDNDTLPDLLVTNLSLEMYALYRNTRERQFQYATTETGLGHATQSYSGWSTKFLDFDNDGWKDIFVAQGHVLDTIEATAPNLKYLQPPLLMRNMKGGFARVPAQVAGSAFQVARPGRGAAFGDIDDDGDIDIVVSNIGQSPTILQNRIGNQNNWLGLRLVGQRSNRDGIGSTVTVTRSGGQKQRYEVQSAAGYLSASDRRVLIGLEKDTIVPSVEIRWPGGRVQTLTGVKPNRHIVVKEPVN